MVYLEHTNLPVSYHSEAFFIVDDPYYGSKTDLAGENLSGMNLNYVSFSDANLEGINLHRANLFDANFSGANLKNANLREANLENATLRGTFLRDADFTGATYNTSTQWPDKFDPKSAGAIFKS